MIRTGFPAHCAGFSGLVRNVIRIVSCRLLLAMLFGMAVWLHAVPSCAESVPGARKSITVVVDDDYPPYVFRDVHGQLRGITVDVWDLWSRRNGIAVNLQGMDWLQAQKQFHSGQADVIDQIFETPGRQKSYEFSPPYGDIPARIFFRGGISGISDVESLLGFTVGVKDGDACIEYLRAHHITSLNVFPDAQSLVQAAVTHEVPVFCLDEPPAMYYLYKSGQETSFKFTGPVYVGQLHWAVRPGDEAMKQLVARGFARISETELQQIRTRWIGYALPGRNDRSVQSWVLWLVPAIVLILVGLLLRNRMLWYRAKQKTDEQAVTMSYLNATLEAIPYLLFEMDRDGMCHDCRSSCPELLTMQAQKMVGSNVYECLPVAVATTIMTTLRQAIRGGVSYGAQIKVDDAQEDRWFELFATRKPAGHLEDMRLILIAHDITERKRDEANIQQLAYYDPLTLLPNRWMLQERMCRVLSADTCRDHHAALLFIDIDNFKLLNDTRGHRIGDLLLQQATDKMRACLRETDYIGRFGGDEFIVILERLGTDYQRARQDTAFFVETLQSCLRGPCMLDGRAYLPTASIGVSLFKACDGLDMDDIMQQADMAMYQAKSNGRDTTCFYDPSMKVTQDNRALLDGELGRAIEDDQFELYFQAQVNQRREILGAEALLRWRHPQRGLLSPDQFISVAEDTGKIVPIGLWVIRRACAQLQQWQSDGSTRELRLSVNVSARQFQQDHFVSEVECILRHFDTRPGLLKFELTESMVLKNLEASVKKMYRLRDLGIHFSLDDFGTGYASLSYLTQLPLYEIKIDRSFVKNVTCDRSLAIVTRSIIDIGRNFEIDVVAEGIENEEQRTFLLENGCTLHQGYLFSRPVPIMEFESLLSDPVFKSKVVEKEFL
jgi:diguanylate cyclase (GGDEF)-like protein